MVRFSEKLRKYLKELGPYSINHLMLAKYSGRDLLEVREVLKNEGQVEL